MQLPVACNDKRLLQDEPFLTSFAVCAAVDRSRRGWEQGGRQRLDVIATQELKALPDDTGTSAALEWFKLAFARHGDGDPDHEITLNDEILRIFVTFYWKLSRGGDDAELFLQRERRKRGYGSFACTVSGSTQFKKSRRLSESRSVRTLSQKKTLSKKKRVPSQRAKTQLLGGAGRDSSRGTLSSAPVDPLGASGFPQTKSVLVKGGFKPSRRAKRGRMGNANKTPPSDHPHRGAIVPINASSNLEKTSAMVGSGNCSHPTSSHTRETVRYEGGLGQDHSSQPPSYSISFSRSSEAVFPVLEKNTFMAKLSASSVQHSSFAHILLQDDTRVNELPMEPPVDGYRCKPPLNSFPPIWAQSRQEVCESFEWFRSYQGGVYFIHDVVKGYLLSAYSSSRDLFEHDGRLIVSHGGGKAQSIHSRQGKAVLQSADDQLAQDKSVRALLKTYKLRRPLVLLIDDKYTLFPYDLSTKGITYAVLGLYIITHVWAECQWAHNERGYVIRHKFAFQWCEGQGEPWWIPKKEEHTMMEDFAQIHGHAVHVGQYPAKREDNQLANLGPSGTEDLYFPCTRCSQLSPQVYQQGWVCLNAGCPRFWTSIDGSRLPLQLEYNARFLQLRPPFVLPSEIRDIRPPLPVCSQNDGITTTYNFTRGWHCRWCGRLSCRFKWEHWECNWCKAILMIPGKIRVPKEFWTQKTPDSFQDHSITKSSGIIQQPARQFSRGCGRGQTQSFILPHARGRIHHIQPGPPSGNSDADIIFAEYQEQASTGQLAFRRWPLRSHKCILSSSLMLHEHVRSWYIALGRGPLLTNYFSQNSGEPYQYVGGTENTVSFAHAPSAVLKARDLIQTRISQALDARPDFNEVLSCAYMERQKMAFHSDSEAGLGPLVAGLSLGSPALMHFRLRAKYDKNKDNRSVAITFVLRHGDILVMDGVGVQEYYEHTVVPTNFRIAATARSISPIHSGSTS